MKPAAPRELAGVTAALERLARAYARLERLTAAGLGASVPELRAFVFLARHGGSATVSELARDQGAALSTMTRNLALLERRGLLTRQSGEARGRPAVFAQLTLQGRRLAEAAEQALRRRFERALAARAPVASLRALVELATALEESVGGAG